MFLSEAIPSAKTKQDDREEEEEDSPDDHDEEVIEAPGPDTL